MEPLLCSTVDVLSGMNRLISPRNIHTTNWYPNRDTIEPNMNLGGSVSWT